MENVRELTTNNFMSYYHHMGAQCPYCNKYEKRMGSIQAINQHIRLMHPDFRRYGRVSNQYLSWNELVFVVYEPCPFCGQMLAGSYRNHFDGRISCTGPENGNVRWLIGAMFDMLGCEQRGIFLPWDEFRRYCVSGMLRNNIEDMLKEATIKMDGFNVYIKGQENAKSQKLYIVVDFDLWRVYIGETVLELVERMHCHRGEFLRHKNGGCGSMIWNERYVMTCLGGFLNNLSGSESSSAFGKGEIKLLEENLRRMFVNDGNWFVINSDSCKF